MTASALEENAALLQGRHPFPPRIHMQTAIATATQLKFGQTDLLGQSIDFITPQNS
jgi:hypothetical protein